ncbi:MAG: DUF420 domain-containing protein [Proteobacteria bacterium]|nr:DUF420 domain-containing protein [Pseudomonadota bacterium]
MDPKVLYWTGAFINMGAVVALAVAGVRAARRRAFLQHARYMTAAALLVFAFLGSYVLKVAFLGREDLATWEASARLSLYVHETCVVAMLAGGAVAFWRGRRLRRTRLVTGSAEAPAPTAGGLRQHRWAGRIAVAGCVLGLLSAVGVLLGMYRRVGWM